jgi:hypothetical protein
VHVLGSLTLTKADDGKIPTITGTLAPVSTNTEFYDSESKNRLLDKCKGMFYIIPTVLNNTAKLFVAFQNNFILLSYLQYSTPDLNDPSTWTYSYKYGGGIRVAA